MKKIILMLSIVMSLAFVNANAQKLGYVNTQELFDKMPEVKALKNQLQSKSSQYENQLKALYQQYQTIVTDLQNNAQTYTQMVAEQKYKDAAALEQKITTIEQQAQQDLANYEATQLKPIEDKAFNAIQRVATANGFSYIFDGSLGILIVKPAGDDITNMVKAELGIF